MGQKEIICLECNDNFWTLVEILGSGQGEPNQKTDICT
jgi:hypothetical protein